MSKPCVGDSTRALTFSPMISSGWCVINAIARCQRSEIKIVTETRRDAFRVRMQSGATSRSTRQTLRRARYRVPMRKIRFGWAWYLRPLLRLEKHC